MTTITEFISARLDDDEQTAQAALTGPSSLAPDWSVDRYGVLGVPKADVMDSFGVVLVHDLKERVAEHIARHDPARVLQQCAALRRVVEAEIGNRIAFDGELCCCDANEVRSGKCEDWTPERSELLRALASAWPDHPDYQEEWKP